MKHLLKFMLVIAICQLLLSFPALCQPKYTANQVVEVKWKDKWYQASIMEVKGNMYKIHYDGYSSSSDEVVPASRIRLLQGEKKTTPAKSKKGITYGTYGCTASTYSNGSYTYLPKGSFELKLNGTYAYNGFSKPSTGTFTADPSGIISFKQGYLNNGQATPIEGSDNRYYLVFPTIPDGRWTCGLKDK